MATICGVSFHDNRVCLWNNYVTSGVSYFNGKFFCQLKADTLFNVKEKFDERNDHLACLSLIGGSTCDY